MKNEISRCKSSFFRHLELTIKYINMRTTHFLAWMGCALWGFTSASASLPTHLTFDLVSGSSVSYALDESPTITYEGDSLFVNGKLRRSFALSDIDKYRFSDDGLTDLPKDKVTRLIYVDNQTVSLEGLPANSSAYLYNLSGVLLTTEKVKADGTAKILLPQVAGLYILKVEGQIVKLLKE